MRREKYPGLERRKYIRLDSVFPVSFQLLSLDGRQIFSEWVQGFTNNIGKGGICLVINQLAPDLAKILKNAEAKVSLKIEMPLNKEPVAAVAKVSWIKDPAEASHKYLVGLTYEQINLNQNNQIMRYARMRKLSAPVALGIIFVIGFGFLLNTYINIKLIRGNKALVEQLVKIVQESSVAKQKIKMIAKEKEDLQLRIQASQLEIKNVEEEKKDLENTGNLEKAQAVKKIRELSSLIEKLSQDRVSLQEQMINIQHKENIVTEELLRLDEAKSHLEKANIDNMYQWLKAHQNLRTGLVASFEGDSDIANWAFTYDQSLALQAFTNFGDFKRARKILDFYDQKAKRIKGMFLNAYYASDGLPVEYVMHSGPNIWLGIAILQYTKKTQDYNYLRLAEDIARVIIDLQNQGQDGGIRGGPEVNWFSTEHNLDAYAFFGMLDKITDKPVYRKIKDEVSDWLVKHTYDKVDIPIRRGKGDSSIATDTYAWAIAAIGPEKLFGLGMNPDRILEFVEQNCQVEASYIRPDGKNVKIKGFDFAPQRHLARGGVVSSEWSAQMVLAFKIMGDFYYNKNMIAKARAYKSKAEEYLVELGKMIISSPSPSGQGESCLPYATQDFVDTGHGWMTPKGKSTGSLAGTTYTIFAYYNYNPLELKE